MEPVTSTHVGDWPASLFLNQKLGWGCRNPRNQLPDLPALVGATDMKIPPWDITVRPQTLPETHCISHPLGR